MVEGKSTPRTVVLDIETLNQISARLYDRAEQITQVALADMAMELRIAARCANLLAHIRLELGEIAGKTKDPDAAREIRDLLDVASWPARCSATAWPPNTPRGAA